MPLTRPLLEALAGALALAAACTLGDYLWVWIPKPHPWWMGVLHGVGIFALVGGWMGLCAGDRGRAAQGMLAAVSISAGLSGSFYLLYRSLGVRPTMLLLWMLLWILFGLLDSWLRGAGRISGLARGTASALLCGLAFYLLIVPGWSGIERGLYVASQFVRWTGVFAAALIPLRAATAAEVAGADAT